MTESTRDRWERARHGVLGRWRRILSQIEARDEPAVLALANVMDEFCEEAAFARESAGGRNEPRRAPLKILTAVAPAGSRCHFCRGFIDIGGCFGLLDDLNQAVMKGDWGKARSVAETYIARLESMEIGPAARDQAH